jgi:hypothetical protein
MKRATKILTLATLATASPALANPDAQNDKPPVKWDAGPQAKVTAVVLDRTPYMVKPGAAPVRLSWEEYGRFLGETAPLVGPDGRPGCGNTLNKSPSRCEPARAKAFELRQSVAKKSAQ